ncbi:MAG: ferritin family protein [Planctomycetota bacterium]|jgi:rubrerythrin
MIVRELLTIARQVELRIARLYEHMSRNFENDEKLSKLIHNLSLQEVQHADIIFEMLEKSESPDFELEFNTDEFTTFIDTIDDVEDEVCVKGINSLDAMEIIVHLEKSVAENFYEKIPEDTVGIDKSVITKMIVASRKHAEEAKAFIEECVRLDRK